MVQNFPSFSAKTKNKSRQTRTLTRYCLQMFPWEYCGLQGTERPLAKPQVIEEGQGPAGASPSKGRLWARYCWQGRPGARADFGLWAHPGGCAGWVPPRCSGGSYRHTGRTGKGPMSLYCLPNLPALEPACMLGALGVSAPPDMGEMGLAARFLVPRAGAQGSVPEGLNRGRWDRLNLSVQPCSGQKKSTLTFSGPQDAG